MRTAPPALHIAQALTAIELGTPVVWSLREMLVSGDKAKKPVARRAEHISLVTSKRGLPRGRNSQYTAAKVGYSEAEKTQPAACQPSLATG